MPTIKRTDGAQFAIHTYRELLKIQRASLTKHEIRLLAQNHGEYVRLFRQNHKHIEAVFSRDPGFLLGEAVWHYFGKPSDLIYCEALPDGQQAIVVIIKSGTVYLDTKIPYNNIHDEFASLVTGTNQYDIYISGDVPLSANPDSSKFVFEPHYIKSFNHLDHSVFQQLVLDPSLQLQPLEMALRTLGMSRSSAVMVLMLSATLIALIYGWYLQNRSPSLVTPTVAVNMPATTEPAFVPLLHTPSPQQLLQQASNLVSILYSMPGWNTNSINYDGGGYQITTESVGGNLGILRQWATMNHLTMSITSNGPVLGFYQFLHNRAAPKNVPDFQQTMIEIIDHMNRLLPDSGGLQVGSISRLANYKMAELVIQFNEISPIVLSLIGVQLNNEPVKIDNININFAQGLLSGTIKLNVVGT